MVHGSVADHTTLDPLADELRNDMAIFSMDRRGFGASGDAPGYKPGQFDTITAPSRSSSPAPKPQPT